MDRTEVVDRSCPEHFVCNPPGCAGEVSCASDKRRHAGAESSVEPLDECGVDLPHAALSLGDYLLNSLLTAMSNHAGDLFELSAAAAFDHLNNVQIWPGDVFWATSTSSAEPGVEGFQDHSGIGGKSIHGDKYSISRIRSRIPYLYHNSFYKRAIASSGYFSPQEESGENTEGCGYPYFVTLNIHAQLISLYLTQLDATIAHHLLLYLAAMHSRSFEPFAHRTLIDEESCNYGRYGATMGEKGQYHNNHPDRIVQSIEDGCLVLRERTATLMTDIPPF